jgi:hypothetical protein
MARHRRRVGAPRPAPAAPRRRRTRGAGRRHVPLDRRGPTRPGTGIFLARDRWPCCTSGTDHHRFAARPGTTLNAPSKGKVPRGFRTISQSSTRRPPRVLSVFGNVSTRRNSQPQIPRRTKASPQSAQFSHFNPGTSEKSRTFRLINIAVRHRMNDRLFGYDLVAISTWDSVSQIRGRSAYKVIGRGEIRWARRRSLLARIAHGDH